MLGDDVDAPREELSFDLIRDNGQVDHISTTVNYDELFRKLAIDHQRLTRPNTTADQRT